MKESLPVTLPRALSGPLAAAAVCAAAGADVQAAEEAVPAAGATVSLRVNFQSCSPGRRADDFLCVFYGGGVKYVAAQTAETDVSAFRALQDTAPGAPMTVQGRVAQSFGGTAELVMSRVSPRIPGPQDRVLGRLQGSWVSQADAADAFIITGSEREGYYAGLSVQTESISVQDSCGGASGRPPYLYAHDLEGGVVLCYEIISASEDELLLSYLPRGQRLRYLRKD